MSRLSLLSCNVCQVYILIACAWAFCTACCAGNLCFGHIWFLCGAVTQKSYMGAERRAWQWSPQHCAHVCCAEPLVCARSEHSNNVHAERAARHSQASVAAAETTSTTTTLETVRVVQGVPPLMAQ